MKSTLAACALLAIAVSDTYDAEATISPKGDRMVFTSTRNGDLDLYTCDLNGENVIRVTTELGYDEGAFFSPDGERILFFSNHATGRFPFNIYMIDVTGENLTQITYDEAFDSSPMFSPDDTKLTFSSNRNNGRTRNTNLFVANWVE